MWHFTFILAQVMHRMHLHFMLEPLGIHDLIFLCLLLELHLPLAMGIMTHS
jgi:hypothetical protein